MYIKFLNIFFNFPENFVFFINMVKILSTQTNVKNCFKNFHALLPSRVFSRRPSKFVCTSFAHEYATIGKGNTEYIYVRVIQRITSEGVFMIEAWFISAVNDCHLNHLYIASRCDCD